MGLPVVRKIGLSFYMQPDDVVIAGSTKHFPFMDVGSLQARTPTMDRGEETVMDDRDGVAQAIHVAQNKSVQTWALTVNNVSAQMIAMYYNSLPAIAWTQSASTITDAPNYAWPNSPVKIYGADGVTPQYMVASITNVKLTGSTTLVRYVDYDYTPGDLARGVIYILPTSTLITSDRTSITMTYVLTAVTAGQEIVPQSGPCTIEGYGEIHGASCEGRSRMIQSGRFGITVPKFDTPLDKLASMDLMLTKLLDSSGANPNGRVILPSGSW